MSREIVSYVLNEDTTATAIVMSQDIGDSRTHIGFGVLLLSWGLVAGRWAGSRGLGRG
jgi:hypothetical protein